GFAIAFATPRGLAIRIGEAARTRAGDEPAIAIDGDAIIASVVGGEHRSVVVDRPTAAVAYDSTWSRPGDDPGRALAALGGLDGHDCEADPSCPARPRL